MKTIQTTNPYWIMMPMLSISSSAKSLNQYQANVGEKGPEQILLRYNRANIG